MFYPVNAIFSLLRSFGLYKNNFKRLIKIVIVMLFTVTGLTCWEFFYKVIKTLRNKKKFSANCKLLVWRYNKNIYSNHVARCSNGSLRWTRTGQVGSRRWSYRRPWSIPTGRSSTRRRAALWLVSYQVQ